MLLISGSVQGVFYRASAGIEAKRHGLVGHACNLMDGRVEVVVEGDEAQIEKLIDWSRKGHRMARVDHVDVTWQAAENVFTAFQAN